MSQLITIVLLLLLLPSWSAAPAVAATMYVRVSGDDSNSGLRPSRALRTITKAARKARGRRGHVIYVGAGRYFEGDINPDGSGRRDLPLTFIADTDGKRTGDAGEVIIDALGFQAGFRITARPWIILNGFSVTNGAEAGIEIKSGSDNSVVANCKVFSNQKRGIRIRDSQGVIVFNNLVYANQGTGVDFSGELQGSRRGAAINNTIHANGLDGLRVEAVVPSDKLTVLHNVISENRGIGLNLKEPSHIGFVGQWNLLSSNLVRDYSTASSSRGQLDLAGVPLLVAPAGADGTLGGAGHLDDSFHLAQLSAGQAVQSTAVDACPTSAKEMGLRKASTRSDGKRDKGRLDLGFHLGSKADFVSGFSRSIEQRLKTLRKEATTCDRVAVAALVALPSGDGPCARKRDVKRLVRRCGPGMRAICGQASP
jgi:parallel beta-helix repeat protein